MEARQISPQSGEQVARSAELRWFVEGELPAAMQAWFAEGPRRGKSEHRSDRYLQLPGCDAVSVRLRGSNLEIKARLGMPGPVALGVGITGLMDTWSKWAVSCPAVGQLGGFMHSTGRVVTVERQCWRRKFAVARDAASEVDPRLRPREGCVAELARLTIEGRPYWSLALEAFGSNNRLSGNLQSAGLAWLSAAPPPRPMDIAESHSYPALLGRLNG